MSVSVCYRSQMQRPLKLLILSLCLGAVLPASAIVTRHDTGYSRFLARESDYPAVFPLYVDQQRKTCAATLISKRWALTAAHCASQTPLFTQLQAGAVYPVVIAGQQFNIDQLVLHPAWSASDGAVFQPERIDLALIRLDSDITHIEPLPLYEGADELGQVMTFLGWGYSGIGRTGIAANDGRLRFARNEVCRSDSQLYFTFNDPDGPDSTAIDFEGIPGLGDSGGPALSKIDGVLQLAGIAIGELQADGGSESEQAGGRYGATVVYERISRHTDWIRQVIAADAAAGD